MNKLRYGQRFSESLQAVTGEVGYYACPLCLARFPLQEAEALTRDHYPPQSIGGRDSDTVLVCEVCRERWAQTDAHIDRLKRRDEFDREYPGMLPIVASMPNARTIKGLRHRAALLIDKDGLEIHARPEANPPEANRRLTELLAGEPRNLNGIQLRIDKEARYRFDYRAVERSFLKAAYLAAFSTLGYPYILSTQVTPIREQMLRPDADIFAGHMVVLAPQPDGRDRVTSLAYFYDPPAATGLAVFFEGYRMRQWCIVFLPVPALPGYPQYDMLQHAVFQAETVGYLPIDRSIDLISRTELIVRDEDGKEWPVY